MVGIIEGFLLVRFSCFVESRGAPFSLLFYSSKFFILLLSSVSFLYEDEFSAFYFPSYS